MIAPAHSPHIKVCAPPEDRNQTSQSTSRSAPSPTRSRSRSSSHSPTHLSTSHMGISQAQEDIWAYRAYVPTLPCANKIIQVKWDQVVWTKHRNKLKSIVQSVDNKEPTRYSHLSAEERARKTRGKLDTETKIQLENKNLLYRIKRHITKVPNPTPPPKTVTGKIRPKPPQPDAVVRKLGLNGPRNRTLRVQTDQANDMYLQRVENSEPFYDTKKFQKDRINTLKYLQSISRFPKRYVQELESSGVHIKRAIPEEVTRKVVTPLPSRQASVVGPLRSKSVSQRPSSASPSPSQRPSSAFSSPFQNANSDISPSSQSTTRPSSSKRISFDAHSTKSRLEYTGEQGPPIPPRYSPKAPLVPRVAKIRPKSAPLTRDEKQQPKERKPIVQLEPRAYRRWKDKLEARQEQIAKEEKLKVGGKDYSGVYMMDELVLHEYLDEFPGDEELFIPNCEGTGWGLTGLGCQISGGKGVSGSGGVAREKVGRSGLDEETVAKALVTGVAFGSSFVMKEPKKYLCRVHVSSVKGSFEKERRKFVMEELVEIRNFCMCLGIEFQWNDLTLGLSRDMDDSNKFEKLQRWNLESSMKDSIAFNQIAFFDHNFYGERDIPTEIDAAVFDQLVIQAHSINSIPQQFTIASEALLEKWYELDENWVPPRRILRPISSVIPEYSDPTNDEAHKKWIYDNKIPLQALMKISAVKLGRNGILEPASVQRFVQSQFQSEVLYGIVRQSRRGEWNKSLMFTNSSFEDQEVGNAVASKDDRRLLEKLTEYLYGSVPRDNRLEMNEGRTSMNSDSSGAPVNPITSAIEDGILHLGESRLEPNRLNEEILVHITQFKLRANDHKLREHLIEKVIAYIFRTDAVSLPPFIISGDSSMGKTAIIGKVIQTCIQRMAENLQERKPNPSPTMKRDESSGSLSSNATSVGTACTTNTVEMQTLVKKTKSILLSGGLSAKRGSIQPVFIARIVGITPDSSTSYGLMKSITHQICLAYNVSTNIDDEISLEMFREALKFATAEKPLVITLAKVDSLVSGPMNSRISWLIDVVPPFVRIIVSAHDEEVITFVTKRIRARAPSVVYAACKNGPPPSQAELDTAHDPYILKVGEIIAPVLKACLKKMNDAAKRKIRGEQAEALRKAFADCTPVNGIVPIRMMKLLHSMSKEWRSFTSVDGLLFPKTIREALEMQLLKLEAVHGKKLVSTVLGLIAMSRDGLTQNEILDLVSLDSELRDLSHKLLPLIYDTKKYFMRRTVWGGEVFSLSMDKELLSVINNRYLSDEDKKQVLADYLTEYFSVGLSTPSGALLQMPLRMPVIENLGFQWNERKIRELPNALIQSGRWHKIEELFSDFEFFAGLVCLNLAHKTCEELYEILLYSHDQEIPVGTQRLLEALLDFMVINRETLNQTHPGLHFVMLQEQLSRLPKTHPLLKLCDSEEVTVPVKGIFRTAEAWKLVTDVTVASETANNASTENLEVPYYLKTEPGEAVGNRVTPSIPLKRMECCMDGTESPPLHQQNFVRPTVTLFHDHHHHICASPDGKFFASGSSDGKVKLFDSYTCTHLSTAINSGRVTGLHFQPNTKDCKHLLISTSQGHEHKVIRWSLEREMSTAMISGKKNGLRHGLISCGFVCAPKGETHHRAFGLSLNSLLTIWDLESETVAKSINPDPEDDDMLLSGNAAVSSDGKLVVFGIRGIRLLNTQTLTIIWTQRLHPIDPLFELHGISQIRFMNDAGSVVVVSDKGSKMNRLGESNVAGATYEYRTCIQQFEVGKGQQGLVSGYLAEDPIHSIAPIEDHSCLAIGGPTGIVDIINLKDGSIIASEHVSHSVTALNYLPDIQPSVFAETKKYHKRATNWDSSIKEYSLDNYHYRLVAGSIDGIMQVMGFRYQPEKIRRTSVSTAACSKDGEKLLIIGGVSKEYKLQNLIGPQNTDRRPSLSNYPVSTPSFENMNEMIARARSGIDDSNNDSAHLLDAHAKAQSRTLSSKSRSVSILKKHTDSSTSGTALKKQVTFSSLPKIHLPEDTEISIWDIPTGKRIISIPISADIIWCDFECSYKGPECFATGERNGIVKIWDWDIVEAASSSPSKQTGDIDYVEFNVCKDSSSSVVVGYSLNPVNHILAVAISIFMPQQVHTEEAPEKFVEPTSIELWNFTTGERFVHYQVGISSLPCVHGPMSNPLLSLSWGNLSDVFADYFPSGSNRRTLPTCLVTGIEKLVVIANEPIPKCAGLKRFIEEKLGVNSVMRCTASCQSSEDARVMLLGVCDAVYWVKEGYDEEVEDVDSVDNDDEGNELISRQPSVVVTTGEDQQPEQDISPSTVGEYEANPAEDINVRDFAVAVEPPPVEIPIPNFRIRKIPTPSGETVISVYHLKTIQVDAIIIATDFGTVAVYDISLPPRYLNENRNEVIRKHAPLISIWHARTSLLGMQVLGTHIPQTKEEFRLDPKNEWRVILWGRNGFTTVLDIRL